MDSTSSYSANHVTNRYMAYRGFGSTQEKGKMYIVYTHPHMLEPITYTIHSNTQSHKPKPNK